MLSLCECSGCIAYNFTLLDQTCFESLLGSIRLQGCLSIDIEVWKCLHVGNFHLQSVEVLLMNLPWLVVCSLMCECTEGCCKMCAECRVPVQILIIPRKDLMVSLSGGNSMCFSSCIFFGSGEMPCFDQQWP